VCVCVCVLREIAQTGAASGMEGASGVAALAIA
jgi:hypothetical protein